MVKKMDNNINKITPSHLYKERNQSSQCSVFLQKKSFFLNTSRNKLFVYLFIEVDLMRKSRSRRAQGA